MIADKSINLDTLHKVLFDNEKLELSEECIRKVEESFDFLQSFSSDKIIYGINTGFGPMAQYRIEDQSLIDLQYNIIRSHSTGAGKPLPELYVKAAMIARLYTFLQGKSGVHLELVSLLCEFINRGIYPFIPEHGSVGASGDLVQLAHIALTLIGEGEVFYQGKLCNVATVLQENGLKPFSMRIREGLSVTNGTSVMTGIGIVNLIYAKKLLRWSVAASVMMNEIAASYDDFMAQSLNEAKHHKGQQEIAAMMREWVAGSKCVLQRENELYNQVHKEKIFEHKVQPYYSLRCVPQILGPIYDELENAEEVLINEINSACDNPIVDPDTQNIYHGGNFHGDYISFEMDKLKIAVTKLTMLCERQINYLFHDRINGILPPFVNLGVLGLNYGLQASQFTATSTTAECQTLSNPMYVHSIPNNNDNQDIVSMGTNSALLAKTVIENSYQVMAIQFMGMAQAIDYLKIQDRLSSKSRQVYEEIRSFFPVFTNDTPKYKEIEMMIDYLKKKINKMKYALVTGGSRGIGRAVSCKLAEMGYFILINYQNNDAEAEKTLQLVQEKGSNGELMKFDVTDPAAITLALGNWASQHPDEYIEVLINNAGIRKDNLMLWMTGEEWSKVLDISLNGFFNVTQPLLKNMLVKRYGRIVNIVSLSGIQGMPGQANYSAAKGGVIAATKALAQEVAKKKVTVNAVAPGFIRTDMTEGIDENEWKKHIPAGRFGTPEEVADLVGFLASPASSYITGEVISINGGLYT